MRTTLTLDDDVANLLKQEVRRTGMPFKQAVNQALRVGLTAKPAPRQRFVMTTRPMGLPAGLSYDNIEELLEAVEGKDHR